MLHKLSLVFLTFRSVSESRLRFPISENIYGNKSLGCTCIYFGFVREEIKRKRADDHVHVQISSVQTLFGLMRIRDIRNLWNDMAPWLSKVGSLKTKNQLDPILNSFLTNFYGLVSVTFAEYKIDKQSKGQNWANHMSYAPCSLNIWVTFEQGIWDWTFIKAFVSLIWPKFFDYICYW